MTTQATRQISNEEVHYFEISVENKLGDVSNIFQVHAGKTILGEQIAGIFELANKRPELSHISVIRIRQL